MKTDTLHESLKLLCISLGYRLFYDDYGKNICTARFLATGKEEHVQDVPYEDVQTYPATASGYVVAFHAILEKVETGKEPG